MAKQRSSRAALRRARRTARSSARTEEPSWLDGLRRNRKALLAIGVAAVGAIVAVVVGVLVATSGDSADDLVQGSEDRLRSITSEQLEQESGLSVSEVTALLEISDIHHWMGLNAIWANDLDEIRHHTVHDIENLEFDQEHRVEMERMLAVVNSPETLEAGNIRDVLGQGGQARDMDSVFLYGRLVELATQLGREDWVTHYQGHLDQAMATQGDG